MDVIAGVGYAVPYQTFLRMCPQAIVLLMVLLIHSSGVPCPLLFVIQMNFRATIAVGLVFVSM